MLNTKKEEDASRRLRVEEMSHNHVSETKREETERKQNKKVLLS